MKKIIIILTLIAITIISFFVFKNEQTTQKPLNTAIEFSLVDTNGNTHTNKSIKDKYLIVNFWATWCSPCLQEIPILVNFYEKNKDKVEILGLNYESVNSQDIGDFIKKLNINYPIIGFDDNSAQFNVFGKIIGLPMTYVYNPQGELIASQVGEINQKFLKDIILTKP